MRIVVRGNPISKARPKFFRRGNHVGTYTPKNTQQWEKDIRMQAINSKVSILEGPLFLKIDFNILRPKSVSVKKRPYPSVRPDLDNYVKAVKDALNGLAWKDDAQVVQLAATKVYTFDDPRVEIYVVPAMSLPARNRKSEIFLIKHFNRKGNLMGKKRENKKRMKELNLMLDLAIEKRDWQECEWIHSYIRKELGIEEDYNALMKGKGK